MPRPGSTRRSSSSSPSSPSSWGCAATSCPSGSRASSASCATQRRSCAALRQAALLAEAGALVAAAEDVDGVRVLAHDAGQAAGADDLRTLALDLRERLGGASVVVVGGVVKDRPSIVVATTPQARERGLRAGDLARELTAAMGGRGGGREDVAQGGGPEGADLRAALDAVAPSVRAKAGV